jgi:two-component system vancomycin resistance associated response regulator VraR
MIRVLIVEDQKMARDSMVGYVEASENYVLEGTLKNAGSAEVFCAGHNVDLILMDVCTEYDESGLDATAVIKKRYPSIKVIIVTSMVECSFLDRAREAGADSFWYKDTESVELLNVMDRTMAGEHIYPERTPEVRLGLTTSYHLTGTELLVLRTIMESSNYQEAADKIGCTERNIRFHLNNILDKTGYRNRFELCMAVSQKKLIIVNPDSELD